MAHDPAINIKRTNAGDPYSQGWDDAEQNYFETRLTKDVGLHVLLYDSAGNPLLTTANPGIVGGAAAHDAAASGNPVQAGGVYRAADPSLDDGDAGSLRVNAKGELITETQLTGSKAENYETITVSDSIETLTPGVNTYGFISVDDAPIRFRVDGGDPTADVGHTLNVGDTLILDSTEDLANFKALRKTTTDAVLHASYSVVA